ncbi:MAG: iron-sulfur cluster assembly protein [Alphaproteobacteria bacterium]|nr:iron-sulfur cluster assembly protein [Alphaproteobacteria bacterium]
MTDIPATSPESLAESVAIFGERVIARLKTVFDPEIPVNIFDLGLIYKVDIDPKDGERFNVTIDMTLTTPNCPIADQIPLMVRQAVGSAEGVDDIAVNLVWDPPWDKSMMSDEARMQLDLF